MEEVTYMELKKKYGDQHIPYSILLTTKEWKNKRKEIIQRDRNSCQICGKECVDDYILKLFGNKAYEVPAQVEETIEEDKWGKINAKMTLIENENPKYPHVHHKFYILGNLPWEYSNDDLILLCHNCHFNVHYNENIKVYSDSSKTKALSSTKCDRCNGIGYLYDYMHVQKGICFKCIGIGFENLE